MKIHELCTATVVAATIGLGGIATAADSPTVEVETDYLGTTDLSLEPGQVVGSRLIVNVPPGGTLKGPKIEGVSVAPFADWLTIMQDGSLRMDVRGSLKTDDGLVFVEYNGIIVASKEVMDRFGKGETVTYKDEYFVNVPRFTTSSKKYAWMNSVQAVDKMVSLKKDHLVYDVFAVR